MGGVEKLFVPEAAERALVSIGIKDPFPKGTLMQALPRGSRNIRPSTCFGVLMGRRRTLCRVGGQADVGSIVDRYREYEPRRIVAYYKNGPGSNVLPRDYAMKVEERQTMPHCKA